MPIIAPNTPYPVYQNVSHCSATSQTVFPPLRLYTVPKDVLVPGRERERFGHVHRRGGRVGISQVNYIAHNAVSG